MTNEQNADIDHVPSETYVGNFVLSDCWGQVKCRYGHEVRMFNINRGHWVTCDTCRTFMFNGSNMTGSWRSENESIWRYNNMSIEGYEFVERNQQPTEPEAAPGHADPPT